MCILVITSWLFSSVFSVCSRYSEATLVVYFFANLGFAVLCQANFVHAKDRDIMMMDDAKRNLGWIFILAPLIYATNLIPSVVCSTYPTYWDKLPYTHFFVIHLMVESGLLKVYFWRYLKQVTQKELFTRPYNTGISI
jgi:hypothetical protein